MRTPTKFKELVLKILTEEEQKELEEVEKENIKTIEEVYKALKEDVKKQGVNRKDKIP